MENTTPQQRRDELNATFSEFIKEVERLTTHFNHEGQKATLRRFEFSYAFETQYETNAPLFSFYMNYNEGRIERRTREAGEFEAFNIYCKALHDLAYAMGN